MKLHYRLKLKDSDKLNEGFFLACKATWRSYNSKYTRKKNNVTCLKCLNQVEKRKLP